MASHIPAAYLEAETAAHAKAFAAVKEWHNVASTQSDAAVNDASSRGESCIPFVNAIGPEGGTPLVLACLQGSLECTEALLALGADPTAEGDVPTLDDPTETYKLCSTSCAAREGHVRIVKLLLACKDVDVNQASSDQGRTALFSACVSGKTEVVAVLLAHDAIEVNKATTDTKDGGVTALLAACLEGYVEVVKLLLAHDAIEVNKATATGSTPFLFACQKGHTEIVKLLLAYDGIEANKAASDDGVTPLLLACGEDHVEVVKMLLAHDGIEVNKASTDDGSTPLLMACQEGHVEVVKMLLAHDGIEVNKANTDAGATPLEVACGEGHVEVVKMLLARDEIDVNKARLRGGVTPLLMACQEGHAEVVKILLARSEIKVATHDSLKPACTYGHVNVLRIVLADGRADMDASSIDVGTAMHVAARLGRLKCMQLLVVYGARPVACPFSDEFTLVTPIELALKSGNQSRAVAAWLKAVAAWSPLQVAAGLRLHKEAALLIRQGRFDPDAPPYSSNPTPTSVKHIVALVATSNAGAEELPWEDAPAFCKITAKLVAEATRGWHRTTHWLHHANVRRVVFAVVAVAGRLTRKGDLALQPQKEHAFTGTRDGGGGRGVGGGGGGGGGGGAAPAPVLPIEMWFHAMHFFKRSWWNVER